MNDGACFSYRGQNGSEWSSRPKPSQHTPPSQIAALCLFGMLAHEFTMKEWLTDLNRWLRWGSVSKEYFGENAHWFTDHFTDKDAPSCYDEIDRYTLKSALKEIAHQILYVAKKM